MKLHSPGLEGAAEFLSSKGVHLVDREVEHDMFELAAVIGADYFAKFVKGIKKIHGIDVLCTAGGHMIYGSLPSTGQSCTDQVAFQSVTVSRITMKEVEIKTCQVSSVSEPPVSQLFGIRHHRYC